MNMRIAIAGGTGVVGRHIEARVLELGHTAVVLARSRGVDLISGNGLEAALTGVEAVIDVSNVSTISRAKSVRFFETATTHLLEAGQAAGVLHQVALSIVGIDRVPFGYYFGKRRQEELVLAGPIPATVLRATQFHEFAGQLIDRGGPVTLVPTMLSQPVAAREVAAALVDLALTDPRGMAPDLAGPEVLAMPDLVRKVRDARGSRRPVLSVRLPGAAGKAMATGGLLPLEDGPRGKQTFGEWLAGQRPPKTA
jgi:uncharacterized protein YbjT (DUF2867 family)